jgi:hypothetical protein
MMIALTIGPARNEMQHTKRVKPLFNLRPSQMLFSKPEMYLIEVIEGWWFPKRRSEKVFPILRPLAFIRAPLNRKRSNTMAKGPWLCPGFRLKSRFEIILVPKTMLIHGLGFHVNLVHPALPT